MRRINLFDIFGTLSLIVGTLFFIFFVLILPRSWTGSNYEALMGLPDSAPTLIATSDLPVGGNPAEIATATPSLTPTATATATPYDVSLYIDNQSGMVLCGLYATPDRSDAPTGNILRGNPPLEYLSTRRFKLPAGVYLLRVTDCDGNEIARLRTDLSARWTWTITED